MKRIWIINQYASTPLTDLGGRHRHLARELAKMGHEVVVVAARQTHLSRDLDATKNAPEIELFEGFRFVRLNVPKYVSANSKKRILAWIVFALKLHKVPRLIGDVPDVVLYSSPSLFGFLGAERLARKHRAKLVFEVRDIWPQSLVEIGQISRLHPLILLMQKIEDRAYKVSECVVTNLSNSLTHMVGRGMDPKKFTWIPNGFSRDEVENAVPLDEQYLAQMPREKFVIGYAGTFGVANALATVLEAAKILSTNTEIMFVLVGHGALKKELQNRVENEAIHNVLVLDPVPKAQVQTVLKLFDVCYLGLQHNNLFRFGVSPNKLFDYLVSGKPIIYSIDSGPYKPIESFEAGISIAPEDPEALAAAALKLYSMSSEERATIGQNGRKGAIHLHEYGALARRLECVLISEDG